jgi:type IV secretory pathway VirB6-like protein
MGLMMNNMKYSYAIIDRISALFQQAGAGCITRRLLTFILLLSMTPLVACNPPPDQYMEEAYPSELRGERIERHDFIVENGGEVDTQVFVDNLPGNTTSKISISVQGSVTIHSNLQVKLNASNNLQTEPILVVQNEPLTIIASDPRVKGKITGINIGSTSITLPESGYYSGLAPAGGNLVMQISPENPISAIDIRQVKVINPSFFAVKGMGAPNGWGNLIVSVENNVVSSTPYIIPLTNGKYNGTPPAGKIKLKINDSDFRNNGGKFYVHIEKTVYSYGAFSRVANWIVDPIKDSLNTVTYRMYNSVVTHPKFIHAVFAALTLYITLYALFFVMALVPMTQTELVIRITKVAVVMVVISPDSWHFFYSTIFTLFQEGRDYLLKAITGSTMDDANLFQFLDRSVGKFFLSSTWVKMAALLGIPPLGWALFAMLLASIWWFLLACIEAVMAYIVALIAISLLITIAPFFIVCLLFTRTKPFFDAWVAHMVNFALQPVMLFSAIALMNEIIVIMFYQTIAFVTKRTCVWNIMDYLCGLYMPVPADMFNPLVRITYAIILMIVTMMLKEFISFVPGIVGGLTGENIQENISTSSGGAMQNMDQNLKGLIGQDDQSINRRENAEEEKQRKAELRAESAARQGPAGGAGGPPGGPVV